MASVIKIPSSAVSKIHVTKFSTMVTVSKTSIQGLKYKILLKVAMTPCLLNIMGAAMKTPPSFGSLLDAFQCYEYDNFMTRCGSNSKRPPRRFGKT